MKSYLKRLIATVLLMSLIMAIVILPVTVTALEELEGHWNYYTNSICTSTATVKFGPYLAIDKSRPCVQHQFCTVFTKQYYWSVCCNPCGYFYYYDYGPITTTHLATQSP